MIPPAGTLSIDREALFADLGYEPHPGQLEVHRSRASRRILACGVRWGKSRCAAMEAIVAALMPRERSMGWIVAPTYDLSDKVFREIVVLVAEHFRHRIVVLKESEKRLVLRNLGGGLSEMRCKSADNPKSLLGEGLDWAIVDEAARLKASTRTLRDVDTVRRIGGEELDARPGEHALDVLGLGRVPAEEPVITQDPEITSARNGSDGRLLRPRVLDLDGRRGGELGEQIVDVLVGVAGAFERVLGAELLEELRQCRLVPPRELVRRFHTPSRRGPCRGTRRPEPASGRARAPPSGACCRR